MLCYRDDDQILLDRMSLIFSDKIMSVVGSVMTFAAMTGMDLINNP